MSGQVQAALEMLKRLSPQEDNLAALKVFLTPAQTATVTTKAGCELIRLEDSEANLPFLGCVFSAQEGSYRSPHSGHYFPPLEEGPEPSMSLRKLEIRANDLYQEYVHCYFGTALSSVYLADTTDKGFSACFVMWKVVHTVELLYESADKKLYQISSRANLSLTHGDLLNLSGNFSAYREEKAAVTDSSPETESLQLLRLVEDSEALIRKQVENFCVAKLPNVLGQIYRVQPVREQQALRSNFDLLMSQLVESGFRIRETDS